MKCTYGMAVVGSVLLVAQAATASVVAYDASGNTLPAGPAFTRFDANNIFSILGAQNGFNAPQGVAGGIYSAGPSDQTKYTFWYSNTQVLDHTKTVEISARLKLDSQTSVNSADRAGLALGLTDDQNLYQEMYINAGEVFINKAGRVRDVAFALDATQWHDYTLRVQGGAVTVDVDGITRLTGTMFDPAGSAPTLANWAVVGDITSSAAGTFEMTSFQVAVVPEPTTLGLLVTAPLLIRRRPRSL
jgi:hypothetical protein